MSANTEKLTSATLPETITLAMIRKHLVPLGERTIFRMIADGRFPPADVSIGAKVRLWKLATVRGWIESQAGNN